MKKNKYLILGVIIILSVLAIGYTDLVIRPGYLVKTLVKAPIFLLIPVLCSFIYKDIKIFDLLKNKPKNFLKVFFIGVVIYSLIIIFYLVVNNYIDLTSLKVSLENNLGINKDNFFVIALYVCIVNSFLEEWFFRGFMFNEFKKYSRLLGYIFSSLVFSLYHVAIMDGMFNIYIFLIIVISLFVGGLILNRINEKNNSIYMSWFCHFFINIAMNTVGLLIFYF